MKLNINYIIMGVLGFIILILLTSLGVSNQQLTDLQNEYDNKVAELNTTISNLKNPDVEASITVPAMDAQYEKGEEAFDKSFNYNSSVDLVLTCGNEIPNRKLMVYIDSQDWTTIAKFQNVGGGQYDGTTISTAQAINCRDGKQFRIGNADGTVTFKADAVQGDLISEATEEEVQKVIKTYDEEGNIDYICSINDSNKKCDELSKFDELKEEVDDNNV